MQVVLSLNDDNIRNLAGIGLQTGDFVKLSWSKDAAHPLL
jgi:hypothetical protein